VNRYTADGREIRPGTYLEKQAANARIKEIQEEIGAIYESQKIAWKVTYLTAEDEELRTTILHSWSDDIVGAAEDAEEMLPDAHIVGLIQENEN
jgi:hypothetical protein